MVGLSWLPRTRGDRPKPAAVVEAVLAAAPHTRGSTFVCRGLEPPHDGCPAHAGIDPLPSRAFRRG